MNISGNFKNKISSYNIFEFLVNYFLPKNQNSKNITQKAATKHKFSYCWKPLF
jgi:hypothetical protein